MTDTIDRSVLERVAAAMDNGAPERVVHAVTIQLNGQHSGVDVITEGVLRVLDHGVVVESPFTGKEVVR